MLNILLGIGCGIVISLIYSFGPGFFSLLQTSVHYGFKNARPLAFGINFSDWMTCILLLTILHDVSMSQILHNPYVAVIGGCVLAGFGIYFFTRKAKDAEEEGSVMKFKSEGAPKALVVWLRGFAINFFNPLMWIYWLSVVTLASGTFGLQGRDQIYFFVGVLVTTVSLDVVKCKLASLLQKFLSARVLNNINKVIGVILIGFAIFLVASLLLGWK